MELGCNLTVASTLQHSHKAICFMGPVAVVGCNSSYKQSHSLGKMLARCSNSLVTEDAEEMMSYVCFCIAVSV